MEQVADVVPVIVLLLLLTIIIYRYFFRSKCNNLPPGPRPLPVIGSLHHLMSLPGAAAVLPHHRFRELSRTYGPLMHLKLGQVSMVVASSPDAAKEILMTHDVHFASRPLFPSVYLLSYGGKVMTFGPYGDYWRQIRKISVSELLSAKRVLSFSSIRQDEVRTLIRSVYVDNDNLVNMSKLLTSMVNNIVVRAAIGEKIKDQPMFLDAMYKVAEAIGGFYLADLFPSHSAFLGFVTGSKNILQKTHDNVERVLDTIIAERMNDIKSDCFLDILLQLYKDSSLTLECVKALTVDLTLAGSETSSTLLQWVMSELMRNPRVMKRAQLEVREAFKGKAEGEIITESDISELSYLKHVIKETLRLHPPGPMLLPRESMKECQVLGYTIPEKTRVFVNVWAIGRDAKYWEDAQEFKPERFQGSDVDFKGTNFEYLPFGAGRRICPGIPFGMATAELPVAQLLYYFDWELPRGTEPEHLDMTESFGATAHRTTDLCLRAIPHFPPPNYLLSH